MIGICSAQAGNIVWTNASGGNWSNSDVQASSAQIFNFGLWDAKTNKTFYGNDSTTFNIRHRVEPATVLSPALAAVMNIRSAGLSQLHQPERRDPDSPGERLKNVIASPRVCFIMSV